MKRWLPSLLPLIFATPCFGSAIDITTRNVPNGTVGTPYSAVIRATGGCTPYVWALIGHLPTGITAKPSRATTSLTLSGTPKAAAHYSFTEKVTGCGGHSAEASYKTVIQSAANNVVDLNWHASTSHDVTGYNVYRAPDGVTWKKLNVSLIGPTMYSDSTVANDSTYYYAATSVDSYGHESSRTAPVKVVIP